MDIITVTGNQTHFNEKKFSIFHGRDGFTDDTVEGDMMTPTGTYKLLNIYYRPDKNKQPDTTIPCHKITQNMGWCDDPEHPLYNQLVQLPFSASHEIMHRDDDLYDIVVEISQNQKPIVPYKGSAIFLHTKSEGKVYTAGCIAFDKDDLVWILENANIDTVINI